MLTENKYDQLSAPWTMLRNDVEQMIRMTQIRSFDSSVSFN